METSVIMSLKFDVPSDPRIGYSQRLVCKFDPNLESWKCKINLFENFTAISGTDKGFYDKVEIIGGKTEYVRENDHAVTHSIPLDNNKLSCKASGVPEFRVLRCREERIT